MSINVSFRMRSGHENVYVILNEESFQMPYRKWTRKFTNWNDLIKN